MQGRFDRAAMTKLDIYPNSWDSDDEHDANLEYLLSYGDAVRDFVTTASRAAEGLLVHLE